MVAPMYGDKTRLLRREEKFDLKYVQMDYIQNIGKKETLGIFLRAIAICWLQGKWTGEKANFKRLFCH